LSKRITPASTRDLKLGLFMPCYIDLPYPKVRIATWNSWKRFGLNVEYPLNQSCCGQPMSNSGDQANAAAAGSCMKQVAVTTTRWSNPLDVRAATTSVATGLLAGSIIVRGRSPLPPASGSRERGWDHAVLAVILGPVVEKVVFRGYVSYGISPPQACYRTLSMHPISNLIATGTGPARATAYWLPRTENSSVLTFARDVGAPSWEAARRAA
jgi:hypothetical protein